MKTLKSKVKFLKEFIIECFVPPNCTGSLHFAHRKYAQNGRFLKIRKNVWKGIKVCGNEDIHAHFSWTSEICHFSHII